MTFLHLCTQRWREEAATNYRSSALSASRITHTPTLPSLRERESEREGLPLFEVTTDGMGTDIGQTVDGN